MDFSFKVMRAGWRFVPMRDNRGPRGAFHEVHTLQYRFNDGILTQGAVCCATIEDKEGGHAAAPP